MGFPFNTLYHDYIIVNIRPCALGHHMVLFRLTYVKDYDCRAFKTIQLTITEGTCFSTGYLTQCMRVRHQKSCEGHVKTPVVRQSAFLCPPFPHPHPPSTAQPEHMTSRCNWKLGERSPRCSMGLCGERAVSAVLSLYKL